MSFKLSTGNSVNTSSSASVSANTDTTATVKVTVGAGITNGYVQSTGVVAKIWINGSHVGTETVFGNGTYTTAGMHYVDASKEIPKSASAQSIPWRVEYWQYTDGYEQTLKQTDTGYITVAAISYKAPYDPTDVSAVRESDNKNIVSWKQDGTGMGGLYPWGGFYILRRTDGGELSRIADVANWEATSYADTTTAANHFYEYAVQAYGPGGTSEIVPASGTLYNTPAAPTKITASRLAETTVKLEIANPASTATALELQRSEDALSWEDISTVEGSPVTETTDEPGGGTFYYRARNTRGDLASEWSPASNPVVTICAPAAPTLKAPASGVVVNKSVEQIVFEWLHNAIDGSAQTAAKLRYSIDKGATWAEVAIEGNAASYALENAFAVNAEVTWSVCTKGVHDDYGPWSDNRVFYVYQAPSVAFAQPTDGFVVENTPIAIQLQYDDPSGTLASAVLTVSDGSKTVYMRNMGTDTSCEIQNTEWTPDNGKVYTLTISARSSSSLSASATREITVSFVLPQPAAIYIENDPETGYASLVVYVEEAEDLETPKSISIWRESKGGRVLLGERLQAGMAVIDRYAPLNTDYSYIVSSFADSGAANSQEFANRINSLWWFVYFEGGMAKAMWDPVGTKKPRRTKDELKERDGREWPVLIQGKNKSFQVEFSGWVGTDEEEEAFDEMTLASGDKVYKGLKGEVFHCHAYSDTEPAYQSMAKGAKVKVSISRVSGGAL